MDLGRQPQRKSRRDGWTPARRERFLGHLATGLDVKRACALVGLSRQKAYTLRGRDAAFAAAWHEGRRAARANREAAFLALLPENLRRTLSGVSTACHLDPGSRSADAAGGKGAMVSANIGNIRERTGPAPGTQ